MWILVGVIICLGSTTNVVSCKDMKIGQEGLPTQFKQKYSTKKECKEGATQVINGEMAMLPPTLRSIYGVVAAHECRLSGQNA